MRYPLKKLLLWSIPLLLLACQPAADNESEGAETLPATAAEPKATPEAPDAADTVAASVAPLPAAVPPAAPVLRRYAYSAPPGDDTKGDTAVQSFVRRVIGYTKKRQRAALVAVADDSIVISYGGGVFGKKEFSNYLADPQNGGYAQIRMALELGGAKEEQKSGEWAYLFPYCKSAPGLSRMPEETDPYMTYTGLVPKLKIYQKPDTKSRLLAQLAYPILLLDERDGNAYAKPSWIRLKTVVGEISGWVDEATVYNDAAMTVVIEKKAGQYRITSVAPFD